MSFGFPQALFTEVNESFLVNEIKSEGFAQCLCVFVLLRSGRRHVIWYFPTQLSLQLFFLRNAAMILGLLKWFGSPKEATCKGGLFVSVGFVTSRQDCICSQVFSLFITVPLIWQLLLCFCCQNNMSAYLKVKGFPQFLGCYCHCADLFGGWAIALS